MESMRQLRWMCRRGVLELDVVFDQFLTRVGSTLTEHDLEALKALLLEEDPMLLAWLIMGESPPLQHVRMVQFVQQVVAQ